MKVVIFCGGLGTRIRDYSESIPKAMIPVGHQPIMLHLMNYYAQYGHRDFVLCLGYKANVIKDFFVNYRPHSYVDCVVSTPGGSVELLDKSQADWRITMLDTGIWRSIGQRLLAVREQVENEEMFFANYSDGLCDVSLTEMMAAFRASGKVACFLAVRPQLSFHFLDMDAAGAVQSVRHIQQSDMWVNGGYFIFRPEIFDYIREGDDLMDAPFARLIEAGQVMAYKHDGFWRCMDTLKDKQALEDLMEQGVTPWRLQNGHAAHPAGTTGSDPMPVMADALKA